MPVAATDSDSDLNDVLPVAEIAVGSNAYQALVGALDKHTAKRKQRPHLAHNRPSAPEEAVSDRQQQQAQQPLDSADTSPPDADAVTADAGADDYEIQLNTVEVDHPDQPAADNFYKHFQTTGQDHDNTLLSSLPSDPVSTVSEEHKSPWANAGWHNTGQTFPKVGSPTGISQIIVKLTLGCRGIYSIVLQPLGITLYPLGDLVCVTFVYYVPIPH